MSAIPYAREQMVSHQLRTWEVLDENVLETVRTLPRELFVPEDWRSLAHADFEIPLAHGQHMLPPKIVGRILQALAVRPGERVLEIGTGSGYLTACLTRLGAQVTSLEIHGDLCARARQNLAAAGMAGPQVIEADAFAWSAGGARFDAVAVTGSLPLYDPRFESLLEAGGRLFVVVGEGPVMEARLISRAEDGSRTQQDLFETRLDALANAPRPEPFRF